MPSRIARSICLTLSLLTAGSAAQSADSDQWAIADALGRRARGYDAAGDIRRDRYVAMFYWTWHQGRDRPSPVRNITEIVREHPEAMKDYRHPAWGTRKPGYFYWEQPLFGYYRTTDPWVLRRHAELLADARIDAVFFDCTNGSATWDESTAALMETWAKARQDGVRTPGIAFLLPFTPAPHSLVSLRRLYRELYLPGKYRDLWFLWKGKPVIMAYPDNLTGSDEDRAIAEFFTFRPGQPDYVDGPRRNDQWGWLENYPQHGYAKSPAGGFEQVPVGVAQNAGPLTNGHCSAFNLPGTFGRSYSHRNGHDPRVDGYLYGWNFAEQWDRAVELDPELVFVTGWNEFIAGQWLPEHGWTGDPFSFVDQFDWERSRDIEPNRGWGDRGDVYYIQLIDNVRRFKGMQPPEPVSGPKTIRPGEPDDWIGVAPVFRHYRGNAMPRDHAGRGDRHYTDNTGRNDIVLAQVARDDSRVYFHVETADTLTPPDGRNWMQLFLDTDRNPSTGWYGYDMVVNRASPDAAGAAVSRYVEEFREWRVLTRIPFAVRDNRLDLAIPRELIAPPDAAIDIEFKWNDNMQDTGDVMDFYVHGDSAPGGRFNFVYRAD